MANSPRKGVESLLRWTFWTIGRWTWKKRSILNRHLKRNQAIRSRCRASPAFHPCKTRPKRPPKSEISRPKRRGNQEKDENRAESSYFLPCQALEVPRAASPRPSLPSDERVAFARRASMMNTAAGRKIGDQRAPLWLGHYHYLINSMFVIYIYSIYI